MLALHGTVQHVPSNQELTRHCLPFRIGLDCVERALQFDGTFEATITWLHVYHRPTPGKVQGKTALSSLRVNMFSLAGWDLSFKI